jgi:DNA-binding beta-propeller fold protein YncE
VCSTRATYQLLSTVPPIGSFLPGDPTALAVTPDGKKVYLLSTFFSSGGAVTGTLSVIDTASGTITKSIYFNGTNTPSAIALSPDGTKLYVAPGDDNIVEVWDSATYAQVGRAIYLGLYGVPGIPEGIAVSPDGKFVYVANNSSLQRQDHGE